MIGFEVIWGCFEVFLEVIRGVLRGQRVSAGPL